MTVAEKITNRTTLLASMLAVTCGLLLSASQSVAQGGRVVEYDIIIDPKVTSLARIEELHPEDTTVAVWIALVPDKTIPDTEYGTQLKRGLHTMARRMSGTFESGAEYEKAVGVPTGVGHLIDFKGAKVRVNASFQNSPTRAPELKDAGYVELDQRSIELEDGEYTLHRWVRHDSESATLLGTGMAQLNLEAEPTVDPITSVFVGNFARSESSRISVSGAPESGPAEAQARGRYEAFRDEARQQYRDALAILNKRIQLFSDEEIAEMQGAPDGESVDIIHTIDFTWYGEPKAVNVIVRGVIGPAVAAAEEAPRRSILPFDDR